MTRRMSIYLTGVIHREIARLICEDEPANAAACLEDLYFYVDENFFQIPYARFSRYDTMTVFEEWATQYYEL